MTGSFICNRFGHFPEFYDRICVQLVLDLQFWTVRPGTVLGVIQPTNKVARIVRLIILYHSITGFGLVQRTYRLI